MGKNYQIDSTDRAILTALSKDARVSFVEIAESLGVVPGTIHLRVEKLRQAGILKRFTVEVDPKALGLGVECLIGLKLHEAKQSKSVIGKMKKYDEILSVYYTTGPYNLFIKVLTTDNQALYSFLSDKLQGLPEIHSTDTVMVLDVPFNRDISFSET
jgi:Lrp/AsnC family transcriptional regulator for asnA, asnC and gidA